MHQERVSGFIPFLILCLSLSSTGLSAQSGSVIYPFFSRTQSEDEHVLFLLDATPYAFITDDRGIPVFQQYIAGGIRNFTPLDDTSFAVYSMHLKTFLLLDRQLLPVDTVQMSGDYIVDFHHISRRENGNLILLGKVLETTDMSGTIWGDSPDATVMGAVIQEFDREKKLLYEWKSLDHIGIGDTLSCLVDPMALSIDYIHVNSIQSDTDSTWIVSCRNLDQVIKIHKETGEILWRLGGVGNQFNFTNDSLRFSGQHSVHLHSNGDLSIFDNGICRTEKNSRALVYSLNQEERTISLSRELSHTPPVVSLAMGNYILLKEEESLIGWGKNGRGIVFTHYKEETVLHEMIITNEYPFYSYAVHPVEWFSPVTIMNSDPINPGTILRGDSLLLELEFHNSLDHQAKPVSLHFEGAKTKFLESTAHPLAAGETRLMKILFIPEKTGRIEGWLTAYFKYGSEPYTPIAGSQVSLSLDVGDPNIVEQEHMENTTIILFPNPVRQVLTIDLQEAADKLGIYSISGVLQKEINIPGTGNQKFSISELAPGTYFILGTYRSGKFIKGRFIKQD